MSPGTSSNAIHTYASSLLPTAKIRRISETTIKRKKISVKRFRNTRKRLNLPNDSARIAHSQGVGSDEYIVAKLHLGSIQYHAVHIAIEVLSYLNVIAIVAIERLLYQKLLVRLAQEFPQYLPSPLQVGRLHQIIFVADVLAHLSFLYLFPVIVGIIQHAPSTFFLFCHHCLYLPNPTLISIFGKITHF